MHFRSACGMEGPCILIVVLRVLAAGKTDPKPSKNWLATGQEEEGRGRKQTPESVTDSLGVGWIGSAGLVGDKQPCNSYNPKN